MTDVLDNKFGPDGGVVSRNTDVHADRQCKHGYGKRIKLRLYIVVR